VKASDATNNKGETEIMTRVSFQPLMKAIKMLMKKVEKYWMALPSLSLIPSLTLFMSLNCLKKYLCYQKWTSLFIKFFHVKAEPYLHNFE